MRTNLLTILSAALLGGALSVALVGILVREPNRQTLVGGQPLNYWIGCLDSGRADQRAAAVANLRAFGAAAVPPLIERLDDDSSDVVDAATSALSRIGPAGVPQLGAGLRRGGTPFRQIRIIGLLQSMGAAAAPANAQIATQLFDRNVSAAAADYFVACGVDADAITLATRALGSESAHDAYRVLEVGWRDQRLRGVVIDIVIRQARTSEDPRVRASLWAQLAHYAPTSPQALALFAEGLDDPLTCADARAALHNCHGREVFMALARVASDRHFSPGSRIAALDAIADQVQPGYSASVFLPMDEVQSLAASLKSGPSAPVRSASEQILGRVLSSR